MRAPDKNRYLNAVRHLETSEIPFQEDEIENLVASRILGRKLPPVRPYELPVEDFVELNIRAGNDLVYLGHVWELGRKNHIDADGRKHYVDGVMKTRESLKSVRYPDLGEHERDLERRLKAIEGTGLGLKYSASQSPFLVTTAVGYQDYYMALYDDPQFIHDFQALLEDFCLRELEMALTYPIDAVQVSLIAFSKAGLMMSREHLEEFELPSLRRRVKMIRDAGKVVSLHADGNFSGMMPELIALGVDVVNPVEPCDGLQDIYQLKTQYGDRMAFHGNIDLAGVLVYGTPDEVTRDTVEHLDRLSSGGGYVAASSHNITEAVPLDNFYAMRNAVHQYRKFGTDKRG